MERYVYEGLLLAIRLRCGSFSAHPRDQMYRNASRLAREVLTERLGQQFPILRRADLRSREDEAMFMIGLGVQNGWLRRDNGHGLHFTLSHEEAEAKLRNFPEAEHFLAAGTQFAEGVRRLSVAA